jgi:hypothetical protein
VLCVLPRLESSTGWTTAGAVQGLHASIPDTELHLFPNMSRNPIPAGQSFTVCAVTLLSDPPGSQNRSDIPAADGVPSVTPC